MKKRNQHHFGGRKDAERVKDLTGMAQISIDLKPHRSVSDVYINQKFDLTELVKYVEDKKATGEELTYFYAFLAAIGRVIYNRPKMNYFVANRHLYKHKEIILSFVAKVNFDDCSEEMMVMIPIDKNDNIFTIRDKVKSKLDSFRNKKSKSISKEGVNSVIDALGKLPNILRVPIVGVFKWCDKKGWLPSSLAKGNLYYSTMIVSNLGSIGCGAIFHNITDFGSSSSLITMGEIHDEEIIRDGKKSVRKICEWGMNFDERIADGYYFAKSYQMLQYVLSHPEMLEEPASRKIEMGEIR